MKVIIFSGLPGSGKSTYLERNGMNPWKVDDRDRQNTFINVESDNYFMKDGEYVFNPSEIGKAHAHCMRQFLSWASWQNSSVLPDVLAVGNTNTSLWEISPYVLVSQACDLQFEIIRLECSVKTALARNKHNVPEKTIIDMFARLLTLNIPKSWPSKTVITD